MKRAPPWRARLPNDGVVRVRIMRRMVVALLTVGCLAALAGTARGKESELKSGPQVGDPPLPFTSNLVSGQFRGQQHCYICDLTDEPALLVFARKLDEPTAQLLRGLRDAVREHRKAKLFAWAVILGDGSGGASEYALEKQTYAFARVNEATALPVSVLGDPLGPPGYLISSDAEVTVVGFRYSKVVFNHAYRAKEWNVRNAGSALKDIPLLLAAKKPGP